MSEKHEVYPIFFTAPTRNKRRLLFPTANECLRSASPRTSFLGQAKCSAIDNDENIVPLRNAALPPNAPSRFTSYIRTKKKNYRSRVEVFQKRTTLYHFWLFPFQKNAITLPLDLCSIKNHGCKHDCENQKSMAGNVKKFNRL